MADRQDEILKEIKALGKTCASIDERTEGHTRQLATINGRVMKHHGKIAALEAETQAQEKDLDELKQTARSEGGKRGAQLGAAISGIITVVGAAAGAALRAFWPSS